MTSYDLSGPALAAPAGVTADFDNPPNQDGLAWGSLTAMMVVATLCLLVRTYKCYLNRKVMIDDVLFLLAYGNYWGAAHASYAFLLSPGFFVHQWDLTLGETITPYYYIFVFGVFYSVVLACVKIAILLEWIRLFVPGQRNLFYWGSLSIIILQASFGVAAIFLLNFQCMPHRAIWDFTLQSEPTTTCLPLNPLQLTSSAIHLFSDVVILLLPQKIIWGLNMALRNRLGMAVMFGLGALAVICSIFRLITTVAFGASDDKMYTICPVLLWATGEMTIGFFVACAPSLPKVFRNSPLGRVLGMSSSSNAKGHAGPSDSRDLGDLDKNRPARPKKSDLYTEIDEDGIALGKVGGSDSESTTGLREGQHGSKDNGRRIQVTRTTNVVVTHGKMDNAERSGVQGLENNCWYDGKI